MAATQKTMSVQVRDGRLRQTPSFLGKVVATVAYGDRVAVAEEKGAWFRVTEPNGRIAGWIHSSALTTAKIVLKAGAQDVEKAATTDELALAGKGFNRQVEDQFRSQHAELDFTWIDRMEKIQVAQGEMRVFLEEGGLRPEGGGQ